MALKRSAINPRYVYITAPSVEVLQERLEQKAESQKQAMKEAKDRERELAEVERRARHQQFAEAFAAARRNGSVNLKHADSRFLDSAASGESEQPKSTESLFKRPTSSWRQERASDLLAAHAEAKQQHSQPFGGGQQSEKSNNVESDVEVDTDALVSKWLEKAQRNMKPGAQNNIEAEKQVDYSEYINEPGFFDSIIINDNLDSAYEKLKEVVMQYYWQKYEEEDSLED